jgi:hypothetical protein
MAFNAFDWHRQFQGVRMPLAARAAAMALFDRADRTGRCFPGIDTLAADTGLGPSGVRNGINWLERNGFVKRALRGGRSGDNQSRSTRYQLTFAAVSTATPVALESGLNRHETTSQPPRASVSTATPVGGNDKENDKENGGARAGEPTARPDSRSPGLPTAPPLCPKHPEGYDHDAPCRRCAALRKWAEGADQRRHQNYRAAWTEYHELKRQADAGAFNGWRPVRPPLNSSDFDPDTPWRQPERTHP